jgi:hypothetical protein
LNYLDLPQRLEPCAEIAHQELRLFPRREEPALVVLVVEDQIGVGPLGPTPRSLETSSGKTLTAAGTEMLKSFI